MTIMLKKNRLLSMILAILFLISIVMLIQKNQKIQSSQKRIDDLASMCINNAWYGFSEYLHDPSQKNYLNGMNAFYTYYMLYRETGYYKSCFGQVLTNTYDTLLLDDRVDITDIQRLVDALELLTKDPFDVRGYSALRRFKKIPLLE